MAQKRAEEGVNRGAAQPGVGKRGLLKNPRYEESPIAALPTLADQGIDKNLAVRARRLAAVAEADFEATLDEHREEQKAVTARTFAKLEETAQAPASQLLLTSNTPVLTHQKFVDLSYLSL
jgi:hypothetical protein